MDPVTESAVPVAFPLVDSLVQCLCSSYMYQIKVFLRGGEILRSQISSNLLAYLQSLGHHLAVASSIKRVRTSQPQPCPSIISSS